MYLKYPVVSILWLLLALPKTLKSIIAQKSISTKNLNIDHIMKEEKLDDKIINQINKRQEANIALQKILDNINKSDLEEEKKVLEENSFIKRISRLFKKLALKY